MAAKDAKLTKGHSGMRDNSNKYYRVVGQDKDGLLPEAGTKFGVWAWGDFYLRCVDTGGIFNTKQIADWLENGTLVEWKDEPPVVKPAAAATAA